MDNFGSFRCMNCHFSKISMSLLTAENLKLLPMKAMQDAEASRVKQEKLSSIYGSQRAILEELTNTLPDFEAMANDSAAKDKEIKELDTQIVEMQKLLLKEMLNQPKEEESCSDVLISTIIAIQNKLFALCEKSADEGHSQAKITEFITLENEITHIISELVEKGQFPLTPEIAQERRDAVALHKEKVINFLKQLSSGAAVV